MLGVAIVALLAGYGTWHTSFGNNLELGTIDARISLRGTHRPYPGVVIVAIDVKTLETSLYGSFPFARVYDAEMIDRLRKDGARTIAYDLIFDSGSNNPQYDLDLYDAAARAHGHMVLAAQASDINGNGTTNVLGGVAHQRSAGVSVGTALFSEDSDGAVRRLPERVEGVQSFAVAAARDAGVSAHALRADFDGGSQWIDFPGPAGTVKSYSFSDVLSRGFNPALLRGRIVVVGATAGDLQDTHTVDYGANEPMTGPELEADAISTLMTGAPLRSAPLWLNWLLVLVAALLLPLLALRRVRWPRLVLAGLGAGAALIVGTQIAFDSGTINLLVPVLATLIVAGAGAVLISLAFERAELALLRDRFARFDPSVVDAVLADPGIALRMRALAIGPESVIAGYRIVSLIGRGGMGVVYEAVQLTLDRPVALKLIDPAHADDEEFRARFVRESHVAASLEHPHVIPVYEAREDAGLLFIAMRLVRGPSLAELFAAEAPLAPARAVELAAQISGALGAAHARGLVHRDVKPANILLHDRDHAYLTDFGVSHEAGREGLTGVGERLGTVDYMSPEQCRGERVGPAADIYSLGCVLYEALTGRAPYPADSEAERIAAHLHDPPPSASAHWPAVPSALDAVIIQALDKDPARRFASAAAFALAAKRAVGAEQAQITPAPTAVPRVGGERPTVASS
ncbi:MAG: CHASE2 domain-containing protein [Solirubrobacteraceae bacterium]|jgi:CHASE2 domain-containing sensor protein